MFLSSFRKVVLDRTVLILAALFVVGLVVVGVQQVRLEQELVDATAIEEARRYSDALQGFRTLYTQEVVQAVRRQKIVVTHDFDDPKYKGMAIPLPATFSMLLGKKLTEKFSDGETKLYSKYPFPYPGRKKLKVRDQFARDAWVALNENPNKPFYRFEDLKGQRTLRYATADLMRKSCLNCHNNHKDSPKTDWEEGHVRGVLEVTLPLNVAYAQTAENRTRSHLLLICIGGVGLCGLVLVIGRLRKSAQELENRVRDRTRQLAETNQELERANRIKSEFVANMSHEVRTPMNAVIGLTELLLKSKLDATQREHLSIVLSSAESLMAIINDILDFSKMEAGKLDFAEVRFNLHDVVGDAVKSLALRAEKAGLELICFIDPRLPVELHGDPGRLRQVLTNLVVNAVKFTRNGEIVVRVEPEPKVEPKSTEGVGQLDELPAVLRFSVRDSGIGIPQNELKSIFQPFEQIDNPLTRTHAGTGLGLAICSRLVAGMRGRIWVESNLGKGSTFYFTAQFRATETFPTITAPFANARVLIVDDNAVNRKILGEIVTNASMQPACAASGHEAIELLEKACANGTPFDLMLCDFYMPEMSGLDLVQAIRRDARYSDLKIILLASSSHPESLESCRSLNIVARLPKPVKQSDLYNAMLQAFGVSAAVGTAKMREAPADSQCFRPLRILLAEDSKANQHVAQALLGQHGHETVIANNGREALNKLADGDIDLVLMDVQMPEMNGLETTAAIRMREKDTGRHTPIVAMTAQAMAGDRKSCLDAGMDEYVSKPLRARKLFAAMAKVIPDAVLPATEPTVPTEEIIDLSEPLQMVGGNRDLLAEITTIHLQEIRENIEKLRQALDLKNAKEVQRLAHTIKGAARFFGAEKSSDLAWQLETMGRDNIFDNCEELIGNLISELNKLTSALEKFLQRP